MKIKKVVFIIVAFLLVYLFFQFTFPLIVSYKATEFNKNDKLEVINKLGNSYKNLFRDSLGYKLKIKDVAFYNNKLPIYSFYYDTLFSLKIFEIIPNKMDLKNFLELKNIENSPSALTFYDVVELDNIDLYISPEYLNFDDKCLVSFDGKLKSKRLYGDSLLIMELTARNLTFDANAPYYLRALNFSSKSTYISLVFDDNLIGSKKNGFNKEQNYTILIYKKKNSFIFLIFYPRKEDGKLPNELFQSLKFHPIL